MNLRSAYAALLMLAWPAPAALSAEPPCLPVRDHNGNLIPCPVKGGAPLPLIGPLAQPDGALKLPSVQEQTRKIATTGQVSFYGGVVQIAAGITQVSLAAQAKASSRDDEDSNRQLVTGLTNIAAGTDAVEQARSITTHANNVEQRQARAASVGTVVGAKEWSLLFEREKAGRTANSVLDQMEEVAKVSADELIEKVNGGENVYAVAAKAKGLDMSPDELATLVSSAAEKAGKPSNPELAPGVKMADLMKDLDMFMGAKGKAAAEAPPAPVAVAEAKGSVSREPAQWAAGGDSPKGADPKAGSPEEQLRPAAQGELMADLLAPSEFTLFAQVRRQYLKRSKALLGR